MLCLCSICAPVVWTSELLIQAYSFISHWKFDLPNTTLRSLILKGAVMKSSLTTKSVMRPVSSTAERCVSGQGFRSQLIQTLVFLRSGVFLCKTGIPGFLLSGALCQPFKWTCQTTCPLGFWEEGHQPSTRHELFFLCFDCECMSTLKCSSWAMVFCSFLIIIFLMPLYNRGSGSRSLLYPPWVSSGLKTCFSRTPDITLRTAKWSFL